MTIIVILTSLTYINIFANGFAWDDKDTVLNWEEKREWSSIPRFILGETPPTHLGNYRPFRNILYIVDDKIWGTHPFGYHLQSLSIEIIVSLLILWITRRISKDPYLPFFTALLFALHPIHVEAVTWITSSMDMFGVAFMFVSLYFYIRSRERTYYPNGFYVGSVLFAWLAFNTNEVTLTLPGLILLFDFFFLAEKRHVFFRLARIIPFAIVEASYLAMRMFIAQAGARSGYLFNHPGIELLVMLKAFARYIQVLTLPIGLTINHELGERINSWAVEVERSGPTVKHYLLSASFFQPDIIFSLLFILITLKFHLFFPQFPQ
jgi:hypothetical protein